MITRTVTFEIEFDPEVETEAQFQAYTPEDVADLGTCVYDETYTSDAPTDSDTELLESDEADSFDEFFAEEPTDDDADFKS